MKRHTLRERETPEMLSAAWGVPICMIMRVNPDVQWKPGARLVIPPPNYCQSLRGEVEMTFVEYKVQPGDTVYSVAEKFSTSMRILMQKIGLSHPSQMRPGEVIRVPRLCAMFQMYTVNTLDTLDSICAVKGVTQEEIHAYNPPVARIYPGAQLILPRRPR